MTELRRLKIKIGRSEFEAEVPENQIEAMYVRFLGILDRRSQSAGQPISQQPNQDSAIEATDRARPTTPQSRNETSDPVLASRIFDLNQDGAVTLKMLPRGRDTISEAMLLLLYGYRLLRNEEYVLATQLFRATERSGIPLRRPVKGAVRNGPFVNRGGQKKGSHYSLNTQGLEMAKEIAKEIAAKMLEQSDRLSLGNSGRGRSDDDDNLKTVAGSAHVAHIYP